MKKSIAILSIIMSFALSCSIVFADDLPSGEAPENEPTPTVEEGPNTDEPETDDPNTEDPATDVPNTEDPDTDEPETDDPNTEDPNTEDPKKDPLADTTNQMLGNAPAGISEEGTDATPEETPAQDVPVRTVRIASNPDVSETADGKFQLTATTDDHGNSTRVAGTPIVNGNKYWVDSDGFLKTGWLDLNRWSMYFNPTTYIATVGLEEAPSPIAGDNGQVKTYMFNNDGVKQNYAGTPVINGYKYWFETDGALRSGWLDLGNWSLYFDPDSYEARTGLAEAPSQDDPDVTKRYMFNKDGVKQNYAGTPVIDGNKYWFDTDGALNTGWLNLGNWSLYFDDETCIAYTGLKQAPSPIESDGGELKTYMFNKDGVKQNFAGTPMIDGAKYWFDTDGSLRSGWLNLSTWKMYFDPTTYKASTGVSTVPSPEDASVNKTYLFSADGAMYTTSGTPIVNGNKYWIMRDSSLGTGWLNLSGLRMYFNPTTYIGAKGETTIDGKNYYFGDDSAIRTGTIYVGNYIYVMDADGVIQSKTLNRAYALASSVLDRVGWNLRSAFNYSAGLTYWRHTANPDAYEYNAIYAFENGRTNCYGMAATFYYMAKLLGYDAHIMSGYVPLRAGGMGPHSWCELVINGTTYVFDPNFTNETGRNGYQINYGNSGTWRYSSYRRVI